MAAAYPDAQVDVVFSFATFVVRQYFVGLPRELEEAAAIDGAGPWRGVGRLGID